MGRVDGRFGGGALVLDDGLLPDVAARRRRAPHPRACDEVVVVVAGRIVSVREYKSWACVCVCVCAATQCVYTADCKMREIGACTQVTTLDRRLGT